MRALAAKRQGLTRNQLLAAAKLQSGGGATTILDNLEEAVAALALIPTIDRRTTSQTVARRFSVDRMAQDYLRLYQRIIAGKSDTNHKADPKPYLVPKGEVIRGGR